MFGVVGRLFGWLVGVVGCLLACLVGSKVADKQQVMGGAWVVVVVVVMVLVMVGARCW